MRRLAWARLGAPPPLPPSRGSRRGPFPAPTPTPTPASGPFCTRSRQGRFHSEAVQEAFFFFFFCKT